MDERGDLHVDIPDDEARKALHQQVLEDVISGKITPEQGGKILANDDKRRLWQSEGSGSKE